MTAGAASSLSSSRRRKSTLPSILPLAFEPVVRQHGFAAFGRQAAVLVDHLPGLLPRTVLPSPVCIELLGGEHAVTRFGALPLVFFLVLASIELRQPIRSWCACFARNPVGTDTKWASNVRRIADSRSESGGRVLEIIRYLYVASAVLSWRIAPPTSV